jgi:hypothetical protein
MGDQADVADPTALRGKQDMIAGVGGVLTVTQDQQHPAATCLAASAWPTSRIVTVLTDGASAPMRHGPRP